MERRALSPHGDTIILVAFLGSQVIKFRVSKQRGREERRKARGIKSTGIKNSFERKTRGEKQAEGRNAIAPNGSKGLRNRAKHPDTGLIPSFRLTDVTWSRPLKVL